MENKKATQPAISIDFKQNRIRIYKRTLRCIGEPEYILLLINPEELTLAILRSDNTDKNAHRLPRRQFMNKNSFEIHSKPLMSRLLDVCSDWHDNHLYRIHGELIQNESVVQFSLRNAFIACGTRG